MEICWLCIISAEMSSFKKHNGCSEHVKNSLNQIEINKMNCHLKENAHLIVCCVFKQLPKFNSTLSNLPSCHYVQ